eukprot:2065566-Karenia_brevis.AAC.1
MPNPEIDVQPWFTLMADYPAEWKLMVKDWNFAESAYDACAAVSKTLPGQQFFCCSLCDGETRAFPSSKALASHMRIAHGIRNIYR